MASIYTSFIQSYLDMFDGDACSNTKLFIV